MASPINYSSMLEQLDVTPLLQGLQQRGVNRQIEAQAQLREQQGAALQAKAEQQAADDANWNAWVANGDHSLTGYQDAMLKFPGHFEQLKAGAEAQTAGQKTRNLQGAMRLGGFINAGLTDSAIADLETRRAALVQNGESTEITDAALAALKKGDIATAKKLAGIVITGTLGNDGVDVMKTLGWDEGTARAERNEDRADRRLDQADARQAAADRRAAQSDARAERREARADAREARMAAGGGKGGGKKGGKGAYSDATLDALLQ